MHLTLALIVKNEARMLPELLAHAPHRSLADELLVLDTGSDDGTPEIAQAAGARVERLAWPGDFAAARNAAIERAGGDWILMLDADERVDEAGAARIRAAAREGAEGAVYRLLQRSYTDEAELLEWRPCAPGEPSARGRAGYIDIRIGRLFPRRPDLRFEGIIHELIEPAAGRAGVPVRDLDAVIHHYREAQSAEKKARKAALYLELSRRQHAGAPDDPQAALELAMAAIAADRPAEAADALRPALTRHPSSLRLAEHLAVALLRSGRPLEVVAALEHPLARVPVEQRHRLEGLVGHALTRAERHAAALPWLEQAVAGDPSSFRARLDLGICRRAVGDRAGAREALERAAQLHPGSDLPLLNLALVERDAGAPARAEALLQEALRRSPGRWQTHCQLAGLAFDRGDYAAAAAHGARARSLDGAGAEAFVRSCAAALALGRTHEARAHAERAAALDPRHQGLVQQLLAG